MKLFIIGERYDAYWFVDGNHARNQLQHDYCCSCQANPKSNALFRTSCAGFIGYRKTSTTKTYSPNQRNGNKATKRKLINALQVGKNFRIKNIAMIYEIPLTPEPQRFSISIGATTYNLRFGWNENDMGGWFMDIADDNENPDYDFRIICSSAESNAATTIGTGTAEFTGKNVFFNCNTTARKTLKVEGAFILTSLTYVTLPKANVVTGTQYFCTDAYPHLILRRPKALLSFGMVVNGLMHWVLILLSSD